MTPLEIKTKAYTIFERSVGILNTITSVSYSEDNIWIKRYYNSYGPDYIKIWVKFNGKFRLVFYYTYDNKLKIMKDGEWTRIVLDLYEKRDEIKNNIDVVAYEPAGTWESNYHISVISVFVKTIILILAILYVIQLII